MLVPQEARAAAALPTQPSLRTRIRLAAVAEAVAGQDISSPAARAATEYKAAVAAAGALARMGSILERAATAEQDGAL